MAEQETAPEPKKPQVKTESAVEEAIEAVSDQVSRSKNPLLSVIAIVLPLLVGGGGFSYGIGASSDAKQQFEVLSKKVDKLVEDAVRREAERHEERIRKLETSVAKLELEVELLKRGAK